ncbi:MAG: hypothetical protein ACI83B_002027 [Sediminicola sp.]|jgi:hypothetical protein
MSNNYTINSIYHIAKADFLQRVRSNNFLIAIGVCIFLIYSFVPEIGASYSILTLGNYRGFYNSAWIGGMVANCIPFFALIGFYVVNYAVQRDYDTGVGQIIATTRITKIQYLFGKLSSNFAVLFFMLLVIAVMTVVMFYVRGETTHLELDKLLTPLMVLGIPAMFIVSAIAVFMDSINSLGRGAINVLYFFLFVAFVGGSIVNPYLDVFSVSTTMAEISKSLAIIHPDWNGNSASGLIIRELPAQISVFEWEGIHWNLLIMAPHLFFMGNSVILVLLAALGFNRFDTTKIRGQKAKLKVARKTTKEPRYIPSGIKLKDATLPKSRFSFLAILKAELKMMLKGNNNLWKLFTVVFFILSAFTPMAFAYKVSLPLLWFFQILLLSKLGSREITTRCDDYIFSSPFPLLRQLPATLAASTLFMTILALPVMTRLAILEDFYGVFAVLVGALFITVTAITFGIMTRGSKLFEVLFAMTIYASFNKIPFLDLIGSIEASRSLGMVYYFCGSSLGLIFLAFMIRKRQLIKV